MGKIGRLEMSVARRRIASSMRDCAIPSAEKVGWKSRVRNIRTVCSTARFVQGLRSVRPPSRWWGTESRWRNDRSFLEGPSVCSDDSRWIPENTSVRFDPPRSRLRGNPQGIRARPREKRARRRHSRGPPRDAAGAVRYIDCRSGLPIFKMARGGDDRNPDAPERRGVYPVPRTPPRRFLVRASSTGWVSP